MSREAIPAAVSGFAKSVRVDHPFEKQSLETILVEALDGAFAMACSFGLSMSSFSVLTIFKEGVFSFSRFASAGSLLPDSSTSLCSLYRCFSMFWVPRAEKSVLLGFGICRQGLQTHFLLLGESQA